MDDKTKRVLIIAGAILLAVLIYVYTSPFQTCKRSGASITWCAKNAK